MYASTSIQDPTNSKESLIVSGDGVVVDCVALVHLTDQSPSEPPVRHPSPYYYSDLLKANKYRKSVSLDAAGERPKTPGLPKRNSLAGDGSQQLSRSPIPGAEHDVPADEEILSSCIITEWDHTLMPSHRLLSHDLPTTVCTCVASPDDDEEEADDEELDKNGPQIQRHQSRKLRRSKRIDPLIEDSADEEDMARQRHLYETAFDCKVSRSDDDLDDFDRVTNHPVLHSQVSLQEMMIFAGIVNRLRLAIDPAWWIWR